MTETETYSFGEWVRLRRERFRLTQREVAAVVHCSVAMIKKIEGDERHPSPELAALLAVALRIPVSHQKIFIGASRGERPVDTLWHLPEASAALELPLPEPAPLPRPATLFIGRTDELREIGERLANPDCRLLTLTGPGGAGKTRLAIAAAQNYQKIFADGVVFVSLAAIDETASIPEMVARSLRLTLSGLPADLVLAYLRRRSVLLVLDNCEQLRGDFNWLAELLAYATGVKVLATSRERLHLSEEWVYALPELAQAVALFIETARRV